MSFDSVSLDQFIKIVSSESEIVRKQGCTSFCSAYSSGFPSDHVSTEQKPCCTLKGGIAFFAHYFRFAADDMYSIDCYNVMVAQGAPLVLM